MKKPLYDDGDLIILPDGDDLWSGWSQLVYNITPHTVFAYSYIVAIGGYTPSGNLILLFKKNRGHVLEALQRVVYGTNVIQDENTSLYKQAILNDKSTFVWKLKFEL